MKEKLVTVRKVMTVLLIAWMFLPWLKYEVGNDWFSTGTSFSGFTMIGQTFISLLLFVMPVIMLIAIFVPQKDKHLKALFMICPIAGIVITVLLGIFIPIYIEPDISYSFVSQDFSWGIGLWLTIIYYAAIFAITMIIELNLNKESFKGDGFKSVAKQSIDAVKSSAKELTDEAKNIKK